MEKEEPKSLGGEFPFGERAFLGLLKQDNKTPQESLKEFEETKPHCNFCLSPNIHGISRIVGYFSVIGNWNRSKQAELKRRQRVNWWAGQDDENPSKNIKEIIKDHVY